MVSAKKMLSLLCGAVAVSAFALYCDAYAAPAAAVTIAGFSPQGEIAQIRQIKATFSESVISFGDPKIPAPFTVNCTANSDGVGRWADDRHWIYDFSQDLMPGTRCDVNVKPDFKTLSGASITGKTSFQFHTGGPAISRVMPSEQSTIEEEQIFILFQTGVATEASLRQHVYCEIEGVHERVPAKLVVGESRQRLLKEFANNQDAARISTVQCQQRFPADAAVRLVWEKGIATTTGIQSSRNQSFKFRTRPAFTAELNCQRENANAACTPILPVSLNFSEGISRKLAEKIILKSSKGSTKPEFRIGDNEELVTQVNFKAPFPEKSELSFELPSDLKDDSGRSLANASQFPLKFRTADFPPLAKFPAAPFGIVELNADAMLPVTLRNVESSLTIRSADTRQSPGKLAKLKVDDDASMIEWISKLNRYHETTIRKNGEDIQTRSLSLLASASKESTVTKIDLPAPAGQSLRPFEVVGIPFQSPGFYVLELESKKLGAALLDKPLPMYVRNSALVTNLSVHIKLGRENGAVWVTTLDNAKPVSDAQIQVSDCSGKMLWRGRTDARGVAMLPSGLNNACAGERKIDGYFVSARKVDEKGRADMAFALSSWNSGIEAYRFNLPTEMSPQASVKAHTILDRSLFRAGETVSMKHVLRTENRFGLALQKAELLPTRMRIVHQGSNQEFQFPLVWKGRNTAENSFAIPAQAKLGQYEIILDSGKVKSATEIANPVTTAEDDNDKYGEQNGERTYYTGVFRVEEFRLPLLQGRIVAPKAVQISPKELPLSLQLNYLNGGGASGLPVKVTGMLRNRFLQFAGYEQFSFGRNEEDNEEQKIVANNIAVTLDKNGSGKALIQPLPEVRRAQELLTEMTYADPNGEIQTIHSLTPLWPAAVIAGIKNETWVSVKNKTHLTVLALDTNGKPLAGVPFTLTALAKRNLSHRKRMVGGFYAYENTDATKDLGQLCHGKSDDRGLFICEVDLKEPGNIEVTAKALDSNGKSSYATTSLWVTGQGEVWFDGENQDRMDILPEKKTYQAGDVASFQVRMPFRQATALVAIEREGVIDTMVVSLHGQDPTIKIPVKAEYGPNVFVSVLAVRGRMREVPWYSFFSWGWKEPLNWWKEFREYQSPSATVDLAKPAYKYGIAEIAVGTAGHQLAVNVTTDKASYPIRAVSKVGIQVRLPDGKPAAGAEVAIAAVDEALLELQPNDSWNLLQAMLQRRSYGVETATAQMQVIGKRHYGRKAVAAGGGGGKAPTRELLDTLLLWKPAIILDANGKAQIEVPLNDALTSFRIVVIAQSGDSLFGTGSVSIKATQDLQIVSGLPPLVREGDRYNAALTVRNTSTRQMQVSLSAQTDASLMALPTQLVQIPAGEAREVNWTVIAPDIKGDVDNQSLSWEIVAEEQNSPVTVARDALKFRQKLIAAVPVRVQQASMFQLDKTSSIPVQRPMDSLPDRGGVAVTMASTLSSGSEGLRRYFMQYPYACLEQKTSKAIGLKDAAMWQKIVTELPTYLDADGLAYYYPPSESALRQGSDTLTAYLISAAQEAGYVIPDALRNKMLQGLSAFVEGKITREYWSPRKDLDVRKLAALEALSRYQMVQPRMLGSLQITPQQWPTGAVLDWYAILQKTASLPQRAAYLKEAEQILRSRLNYQGTRMGFSNEGDDYWWWLMSNADVNANRLLLLMMDNPAWQADMPKIFNGSLQRQNRGHWTTTTANVWGSLAMEKFAKKFESEKVTGSTRASIEQVSAASALTQNYSWGNGGKMMLSWPVKAAPNDTLKLQHDGKGKPWITLQSLAAVPLKAAFSSGYRMTKTLTPVEQKQAGQYSRGDVIRVNIDIDAQADMTWVVVTDPVPAGASLLGSGLGRDSVIATSTQQSNWQSNALIAYEERSFEAFRTYYQFIPKGKFSLSYTVRLNNAGEFHLPATRAEAMYAPEMFGELPNTTIFVK
ncbi:alpha-2-macroglobulin family protein [Undibacterium sp. SXout7W]|uniref:alpha-2-macroglobulin family protein n=1 Tax=Undibacterium sp. SXout7W TaxID=3413049 RepID=UPI003BF0D32C